MNKEVSIIVPIYNAAKSLAACLDSILMQSYSGWECICVDDGSTDSSSEIVRKYIEQDIRFKYYHKENGGPSSARNCGLAVAAGEYIVFVDSDDTILSDYLERLVSGIESSNADVCCCGYEYIGQHGYKFNDYYPIDSATQQSFVNRLFKHTGGCVWGGIYRNRIIRTHKLVFDERYDMCEDQLFKFYYFLNTQSFSSINYHGYRYYETEGSLSRSVSYEKWRHQIIMIEEMREKMRDAGYHEGKINSILAPKEKNVLAHLVSNCAGEYQKLYHDPQIYKLIRKIKVTGMSDIKWLVFLKMKLFFLIKLANKS